MLVVSSLWNWEILIQITAVIGRAYLVTQNSEFVLGMYALFVKCYVIMICNAIHVLLNKGENNKDCDWQYVTHRPATILHLTCLFACFLRFIHLFNMALFAPIRDVTGNGWFPRAPLWNPQVDLWQLDLSPVIMPVLFVNSISNNSKNSPFHMHGTDKHWANVQIR